MKPKALEKMAATAREQASVLERKVEQLALIARTAKAKARQAKSKLKMAKQEAKRARLAAKEAKRAFSKASEFSETATAKAAALESKLQKRRKKLAAARAQTGKSRPAVTPKALAAQPRRPAPVPATKPSTNPVAAVKPGSQLNPKSALPRRESSIQVPRDFEAAAPGAPKVSPTKSDMPTLPGR